MKTRRHFFKTLLLATPLAAQKVRAAEIEGARQEPAPGLESRADWVRLLTRVAEPVLANLAANQLKARMPVECPTGNVAERGKVTHLEALGRTLCGTGPWLSVRGAEAGEESVRARFADLARQALGNAVDPAAADFLVFTAGGQNLVDAAFLALGIARGRTELWDKLDAATQERLVVAFTSTRKFKPPQSNWLLFSAMIEAFLANVGHEWLPELVENALRSHEEWYKGDGAYGDGPEFHWDYYNSFVIQPFLLDVLDLLAPVTQRWAPLREQILRRAQRYSAVQERLISPDGTFPPLGRSLAYRCGAFHHLAAMTLRRDLPKEMLPAQVRGALSAVISRTLNAPGTFDSEGWLRVGLVGHQPSLAEQYISTGSLYLCTTAFLPLGLPPADPFWAAPAADWTSRMLWKGENLPADHALKREGQ